MHSTNFGRVVLLALTCILFFSSLGQSSPHELVKRDTPPSTSDKCPNPIRIISGKGAGATNKNGRLQSLINKIKNKYPGTVITALDYGDDTSSPQARQDATVQMTSDIKGYAHQCPHNAIMVLGYSMGGIAAMNTLCGDDETGATGPLDTHYKNNIFATVLYGEETWRADQSYDRGTCTNDAPDIPRQNLASCAPFAPNIASWCDADDPYCCTGGTGGIDAHLAYPNRYDNDAFAFVQEKYNAWLAAQPARYN